MKQTKIDPARFVLYQRSKNNATSPFVLSIHFLESSLGDKLISFSSKDMTSPFEIACRTRLPAKHLGPDA